jgi:HAMP domain-containing protein
VGTKLRTYLEALILLVLLCLYFILASIGAPHRRMHRMSCWMSG